MKINLLLLCLVLLPLSVIAQEVPSEKPGKRPSPHGIKGECHVCHLEPEETLNSWYVFGFIKRRLRLDWNEVCQQCHGVDFGHGLGEVISGNELPLDDEGRITCAVTCHNMHVIAEDYMQNRYHLRNKVSYLCGYCHKK